MHFFPLAASPPRLYCGAWAEGDAWTALPVAVTCPECARLVAAELADARRAEKDPAPK